MTKSQEKAKNSEAEVAGSFSPVMRKRNYWNEMKWRRSRNWHVWGTSGFYLSVFHFIFLLATGQLLPVPHFTSVEELRFRKVIQLGGGHMTAPDDTLVYMQSPRASHATWINRRWWAEASRQTDLPEIWVRTLPFVIWVTLGKFLKPVKPQLPYL